MTPKFVRLIQNWSGLINTPYTWKLVLFYETMDYSREEGDASAVGLSPRMVAVFATPCTSLLRSVW